MKKITPFLWFNNNAYEAMMFYVSIFKNSKIMNVRKGPDGKMFTGTFILDGQEFHVLNGGPMFKFNESISLFVDCKDQKEIDYFWDKLSKGGKKSQCGWLKDRYGLSWQIVPSELGKLLSDPKKSGNVMNALLKMKKIEIKKLKDAGK